MLPLPSHVTAVLIYLEPGKYDQPLLFCQKPTLVIPQLILFSIPFQVKWQFFVVEGNQFVLVFLCKI